jgi:DNA-binding transcriptional MerR regulator
MLMIKHDDALKTIGEVSSLIEVPVYVIRFWETKFKDLNPIKKNKGSRYYSKDQIDLLKKIKYLLYEKKLTIKGAIQNIAEFDTQKKIIIDEIKELINEIKNNL